MDAAARASANAQSDAAAAWQKWQISWHSLIQKTELKLTDWVGLSVISVRTSPK
jgi:hypothetical protein